MTTRGRQIVLAARPKGRPELTDFRLEETAIPTPAAGQLLLEVKYLSLDPYMRGRMNDGKSYVAPLRDRRGDDRRNRRARAGLEQFRVCQRRRRSRANRMADARALGRRWPAQARSGRGADHDRAWRARNAGVHRVRRPARDRQAAARRNRGRRRGQRSGRVARRTARVNSLARERSASQAARRNAPS